MELVLQNIEINQLYEHFGWLDEVTYSGEIALTQKNIQNINICDLFFPPCNELIIYFEIHFDEEGILLTYWNPESEEELYDLNLKGEIEILEMLIYAFVQIHSLDYDTIKNFYIKNFKCNQTFLDLLGAVEKCDSPNLKMEIQKHFLKDILSSYSTTELIDICMYELPGFKKNPNK